MKKNFYRAFEEKYRGSRELITGRLQFYLPFIEPLVRELGRVPAIDLGCGRGEWLEVLLAAGFDARGIDLDEGMLQACVDLGLPADKGEAIAHLRSLPSKSQAIVSAFHVVEHIPFDALEELVSEAKRVLLPGGLLILETPNPENIMVATCSFYLDPTHQRPIPPNLLSFVAEHAGFERVKVIRLQESKELAAKPDLLLEDVLGGVSPDYSVVAQKNGKKSTMSALEPVFSQDYGLTLSGLSASYDAHMKGKLGEEKLNFLKEQLEAEKNRANNLATERLQLAERVTALESERSTLSSDNASLATRHQLLATECEALSARLSTLTAERDSLATEREALQQQLDEIQQANHGHWQLAESLKQELAAKELAWSEERSTLDARLSTLVAERDELATRHALLATEREALSTLHHQVSTEREALNRELAAKDDALTATRELLAQERSTNASEKSALEARLTALTGEHTELATRHALLATEREALSTLHHQVSTEREALNRELAAKDDALTATRELLAQERSTNASEKSTLEAHISALDTRLSTLASENTSLATSNSLLATERAALASRIEEVAGEAAVARAQSEFLKQELAAKEQAWSEERSALDARLSTLSSENTSLATSNSLLVTEREALTALHSTLATDHEALHQANHGHWQLSENLKQELAAKEQAWSEERSTLDSRLSSLLAERDTLATSNSSLATEREALLASTCWRITAPIRWMRGGVRIPWPAPNEPLDDFFLKHAALYIRRRPHLKERALRFLFQNPKWHARVLPVLQGIKASTPSPQASQPIPQPVELLQPAPQPAPLLELFTPQELPAPIPEPAAAPVEPFVDLSGLPLHARHIYADLKKAIEMKKGEVSA
jgi:O-antigen chain-terminating methyltransferase